MKNTSSTYWVLVADSGRAHILELRRTPAEFREVEMLISETQHLPSRELTSDASGRSFNVQGPSGHTKQSRSDSHDLAEKAFSRMLADKLEHGLNQDTFEHLAIIADPKTLGRLRRHMSKSLSARVKFELNRDLAGMPLHELEDRVRAELGW